jgi:hypothetical protein
MNENDFSALNYKSHLWIIIVLMVFSCLDAIFGSLIFCCHWILTDWSSEYANNTYIDVKF